MSLEFLEDRTVPSTIMVASATDTTAAGSFRAALTQANTDAFFGTSDTITISPSLFGDTITLTLGSLELTSATLGASVTIDGGGIAISGVNSVTVFNVDSLADVIINGLTIEGGSTSGNGGGINNAGTLTISDTVLSNNTAGTGGGMYNTGSLTVNDCIISANSSSANGGGIYTTGTAAITDSTISDNVVGFAGGGLYGSGSITVSASTVTGNSSDYGGGVFTGSSTITVSNCTISSNTADNEGGGILNTSIGLLTVQDCTLSANSAGLGGGVENLGTLTISDSTLVGNIAFDLPGDNPDFAYGAGIYNNNAALTVRNCTLADNSASNSGGALLSFNSEITISNSTIVYNTAGVGGGILSNNTSLTVSDSTIAYNSASPFGGGVVDIGTTVVLLSTIVAGNTAGSSPDIYGNVSGSNNLIENTSGGTDNGTNELHGVAPIFQPLGNYGGPTDTMPLEPSSAGINGGAELTTLASNLGTADTTVTITNPEAIASTPGDYVIQVDSEQILVSYNGAGVFTVVTRGYNGTTAFDATTHNGGDGVFLALDQNGRARVSDGGPVTDIGASEILVVTTDSDASVHGSVSLRDAIGQANIDAANGLSDTIDFASTLNGDTITLSGTGLTLTGGSGTITINGGGQIAVDGAGISGDFDSCFTVEGQAVFNELAIQDGFDGIDNTGTLTVNDCTISGNTGIGIINNSGAMTVNASTVSDNGEGGGAGGGIDNFAALTVTDSTISGNSSQSGGGGIFNFTHFGLVVSDSTICGNSAFDGGGIDAYSGSVTLLSTIVADNSASPGPDIEGTISGGGNNLIGNGSGLTDDGTGDTVGTEPTLLPLGNYGGPTETIPNAPGSAASNGGGALTMLEAAIGASDTSLTLANPAAITSTPSQFVLQIDSEQILVAYTTGGAFTVVQRGYNGTLPASHLVDADVFLADDQRGVARVAGSGVTDIGAVEGLVVNVATDPTSAVSNQVSLREALAQAGTDATNHFSDTITFAAALDGQTISLTQGTLALNDLGSGTITIDGGGEITIAGNSVSSVFSLINGANAVFEGMTIKDGGGSTGGGIDNNGSLSISDCTLTGNIVSGDGGGIYNGTVLRISNSTITANVGLVGNGIYNANGDATISDCTVSNNSVSVPFNGNEKGGGIYNSSLGVMTVSGSSISANTSSAQGGGIDNEGLLTAIDCTIVNNVLIDGFGGGIANNGTATISDCTLSANAANNARGGGIYTTSTLTLLSSIIAGNTADSGGNDIYDNLATPRPPGPQLVTGSYNIIADNDGITGFTNNDNHNQVGVANPLESLSSFGNNGGPTSTLPIMPGSDAIGKGGALTTLTSSIGAVDTLFTVADPEVFAVTPQALVISVDGEEIYVAAVEGEFFVLQRGYNDTPLANPVSSDSVFLATDQRGDGRVVNGATDVGAFQETMSTGPLTLPQSTAGVAYSQTIDLNGGTPAYTTFSIGSFNPGTTGLTPSAIVVNTQNNSVAIAATAVAGGTVSFTINVTDAQGETISKNYSITVNAAPLITALAVTDEYAGTTYPPIVISQGGTGTVTYAVTSGALPTGITLNSNGTFSGSSTDLGNFTFTITATDSLGATTTQSYDMNIIAVAPSIYPVGSIAAASGYDTPVFSWESVSGTDHYYLYVVDVFNENVPVINEPDVTTTTFATPTSLALTPGHTYIWYVYNMQNAGDTAYTINSYTFTLAGLAAPTLVSPIGGTTIAASSGYDEVTFTWNAVPGANHYYLYGVDILTPNTPAVDFPDITTTSYTLIYGQNLTPGQTYVWYVYAMSTNDQAYNYLPGQTFSLAPVTAPTLVSPSNGTTIAASSGYDEVTFSWNVVPGAGHYYLYGVDNLTPDTPAVDFPDITTTSYTLVYGQNLTPGHTYTWYVYAFSTNGWVYAYNMAGQTFTLAALAAPTLTSPVSGTTIAASSGYDLPTFTWNAVPGAGHYYLYGVDNLTPNTPAIDVPDVTGTTCTLSAGQNLTPGHTYTWYVYAFSTNSFVYAYNMTGQTFTLAALAAPTLINPASGTTIAASSGYTMPTFAWSAVLGADHYYLYAVDDTQNAVAVNVPSVGGTTYALSTAQALTPGDTFTWYVYAFSANDQAYTYDMAGSTFTLAPLI